MSSHDDLHNRRHFLKLLGAFGAGAFTNNPFDIVTNGLANGIINRAVAETTGQISSKKYLNIFMPGGPARFGFDQWIKLKANEQVIHNPYHHTKIVNNKSAEGYFEYKGILTPHLFSQSVSVQGQSIPLSTLLNNMMVMRGFATGFDGHIFNAVNQLSPLGGVVSTSGLFADHSGSLIDAIQFPFRGGYSTFTSHAGKSINTVSSSETNPIRKLMEGFLPSGKPKVTSLKQRRAEAIDLAQRRLQSYALSSSLAAKSVGQNLVKAKQLVQAGVADVDAYWGPKVQQYTETIMTAMRDINIPGISDHALLTDDNYGRDWSFHLTDGNTGRIPTKGYDIREAVKSVRCVYLAESLACAEYLFKEGYSDVFEGMLEGCLDFNLKYDVEDGTSRQAMAHAISDMHETGINGTILYCNQLYRGLSAGLLLFIKNIGAEAFKNTVIHLTGDFSRIPRAGASGSDHGFNMMTTSVISGAFTNGPFVVGDILRTGYSGYEGTIGLAGKIKDYSQGTPNSMMPASNIAALMKFDKNPWGNLAAPLVVLNGDQLQLARGYTGAKIVDEG